ncbi:hypothetical protein P9112_006870 [Eukaryota sp. TZLM1-RC]
MSFADDDFSSRPPQPRNGDTEYMSLHSSISHQLQQITSNTNRYEQFLQQVGSPKDTIEFRQKAAALARKTLDDINTLTKLMTSFSKLQASTPEEESKRNVERKRLLSSLHTVQQRFNKTHTEWTKATARVVLNPVSSSSTKQDERTALMEAQRDEREFMQSQVQHNEALIKETERDVASITKDLTTVNSMMRDMAMLVKEQEEMVDSIDAHIELTEQQTSSATSHLERASNRQRRSRGKICCLLLFVLLLAVYLVFMYYRQ